jgi:putative FmdB family regulatory protein
MAVFDLSCKSCGHKFQLVTRGAIKAKQKRCQKCDGTDIKQSFGSYLRNGPLSDPNCGAPACTTSYG